MPTAGSFTVTTHPLTLCPTLTHPLVSFLDFFIVPVKARLTGAQCSITRRGFAGCLRPDTASEGLRVEVGNFSTPFRIMKKRGKAAGALKHQSKHTNAKKPCPESRIEKRRKGANTDMDEDLLERMSKVSGCEVFHHRGEIISLKVKYGSPAFKMC